MRRDYKYHYFYKITNLITNQYYYGIHSTNNLNDGYMGSGSFLKKEYKKYGKHIFKKDILKYFNNREDLIYYEQIIINECMLSDPLCLNITRGGNACLEVGFTIGLVTVRDKKGNCFDVKTSDPRYLSGELISVNKHKVTVRDKGGNTFKVYANDPRYLSGELTIISKGNKGGLGRTMVSKNGENKFILKEELQQYLDDGWANNSTQKGRISPTKNKTWIYKNYQMKCVSKEELQKYLDEGWIKGRIVNSLKNKIGIMKGDESKYVSKEELQKYLDEGWIKGLPSRNKGKITVMGKDGKVFHVTKDDPLWKNKEVIPVGFKNGPTCKGLKYINKNGKIRRVKPEELQKYLDEGWSLGMKCKQ